MSRSENLKDRRSIDMATNPATTIVHRTSEEEKPPVPLSALLAQPLQIQHLPQRHPPQCQDVLMQPVRLRSRPALESWRITPNRCEVAVMQPVEDRLFLLQASVALVIRQRIHRICSKSKGIPLLTRGVIVLLYPARADKDDVADLDVASLSGGADVNALGFAASFEIGVGD